MGQSVAFWQRFVTTKTRPEYRNVGRRCLCGRGTVAAVDDPIRPARRRGALELFTTPLFDPQDPSFHMFDWMVLSDWATDVREVVRFDGDVSVLHVITEFQSPVSQAINYHEGPTTFAMYARTGVVYVTGALLGVTGLVIIYMRWKRQWPPPTPASCSTWHTPAWHALSRASADRLEHTPVK
ncbi:hypothetical protein AaE_004049 [Aphanomyces astaci]|uniref:Uncharacterized protein n=1 Tax=Aphanomyces astaci TaxID=112090 RepID=A0A6A5AQT6_APHAT|nr:hypothetical protein AaE_004049 [Aphanomyces astaci]